MEKIFKQHICKENFIWICRICTCEYDKIGEIDEYLTNCTSMKYFFDISLTTSEYKVVNMIINVSSVIPTCPTSRKFYYLLLLLIILPVIIITVCKCFITTELKFLNVQILIKQMIYMNVRFVIKKNFFRINFSLQLKICDLCHDFLKKDFLK